MSSGLSFPAPSSCPEGDSSGVGGFGSVAGILIITKLALQVGGSQLPCSLSSSWLEFSVLKGGETSRASLLPASFRLSYPPPGSDVDSYTHTHTPLPIRFLFRSYPEKRGGATSGPASLLAWLRALPGPLLGSNRGAALSAFHMRLWDRVCVGGGAKPRWVPQSLQLCRSLEKQSHFV